MNVIEKLVFSKINRYVYLTRPEFMEYQRIEDEVTNDPKKGVDLILSIIRYSLENNENIRNINTQYIFETDNPVLSHYVASDRNTTFCMSEGYLEGRTYIIRIKGSAISVKCHEFVPYGDCDDGYSIDRISDIFRGSYSKMYSNNLSFKDLIQLKNGTFRKQIENQILNYDRSLLLLDNKLEHLSELIKIYNTVVDIKISSIDVCFSSEVAVMISVYVEYNKGASTRINIPCTHTEYAKLKLMV